MLDASSNASLCATTRRQTQSCVVRLPIWLHIALKIISASGIDLS